MLSKPLVALSAVILPVTGLMCNQDQLNEYREFLDTLHENGYPCLYQQPPFSCGSSSCLAWLSQVKNAPHCSDCIVYDGVTAMKDSCIWEANFYVDDAEGLIGECGWVFDDPFNN